MGRESYDMKHLKMFIKIINIIERQQIIPQKISTKISIRAYFGYIDLGTYSNKGIFLLN